MHHMKHSRALEMIYNACIHQCETTCGQSTEFVNMSWALPCLAYKFVSLLEVSFLFELLVDHIRLEQPVRGTLTVDIFVNITYIVSHIRTVYFSFR